MIAMRIIGAVLLCALWFTVITHMLSILNLRPMLPYCPLDLWGLLHLSPCGYSQGNQNDLRLRK